MTPIHLNLPSFGTLKSSPLTDSVFGKKGNSDSLALVEAELESGKRHSNVCFGRCKCRFLIQFLSKMYNMLF